MEGAQPSLLRPKLLPTVFLEPRIRETAKGAREGMPRSMSYQEACETQRKLDPEKVLPLLESDDQAWIRGCEFVNSVIDDAMTTIHNNSHDTTANASVTKVLVVSHSNFLRILLRRLLGEDRLRSHPHARFEPGTGLFIIPNSSLTILSVSISNSTTTKKKDTPSLRMNDNRITERSSLVTVEEMTTTDHLRGHEIVATTNGE